MKRFTLLAVLMLIGTTVFAQQALWGNVPFAGSKGGESTSCWRLFCYRSGRDGRE